MKIEEIIRAWKADEETLEPHMPASPVGHELSEQELLQVNGGGSTFPTCDAFTCSGHTCLGEDTRR